MTITFKILNGDWVINPAKGGPVRLEAAAATAQNIRIGLTSAVRASGFGAGLDDLIGQDIDPFNFQLEVTQRIRSTIAAMQLLQARYLSSRRPATERIQSISKLTVGNVDLGSGQEAKTAYQFQLAVKPVSGTDFTLAAALPSAGSVFG